MDGSSDYQKWNTWATVARGNADKVGTAKDQRGLQGLSRRCRCERQRRWRGETLEAVSPWDGVADLVRQATVILSDVRVSRGVAGVQWQRTRELARRNMHTSALQTPPALLGTSGASPAFCSQEVLGVIPTYSGTAGVRGEHNRGGKLCASMRLLASPPQSALTLAPCCIIVPLCRVLGTHLRAQQV